MVVVLLLFLCDNESLILKLNQETYSYLHEGWFLIGRFKVGSVTKIQNRAALALFMYKPT